jgi:hypothetical protein
MGRQGKIDEAWEDKAREDKTRHHMITTKYKSYTRHDKTRHRPVNTRIDQTRPDKKT